MEGLRSTGLVFNKFLSLTNIWALITRRKLQNPPKITLHGNCHSSAPITDTKVPRVTFKDNGHNYLFLQRVFYEKFPIVVLDEVEFPIKVE